MPFQSSHHPTPTHPTPSPSVHSCVPKQEVGSQDVIMQKEDQSLIFFFLRRGSWKACLPKVEQSLMQGLPNSISAHVKLFWLFTAFVLLGWPLFAVV